MSELKRKYRAAPRQRSPDHLDSLILACAEHNIPARKRLTMSPWKTAMASFCVAGVGIALLLRFGVPSLESRSSAMPDSFDDAVSVESKAIAGLQKDASVMHERDVGAVASKRNAPDIDRAETASTQIAGESIPEDLSSAKGQVAEAASADLMVVPLELAQPIVSEAISVVSDSDTDVVVSVDSITEEIEPTSGATALRSPTMESDSGAPAVVTRSSALSSPLSTAKTHRANETEIGQRRMKSLAGGQIEGKQVPVESALAATQSESAPGDAARWIARQSALHFTLQLAVSPDADYLLEFGLSLNINQTLYVVDLSGNQSGDSFGLFYGVFDTADQALKDINSLNKKVTELSPRVRSFNELRSGFEIP